MKIAYFCAEYAIQSDLPTYAGGLGVLAGDYIRETIDQKFPLTAVGLYYSKGQNHKTRSSTNPRKFGLKLVRKNLFQRLLIQVPIGETKVYAQVWRWNNVYFLDTDIKENPPSERLITEQLYAEDRDLRLKQELLLGIGGVRLLKELRIEPDKYHLNEGHSAFLALELLGKELKAGQDFESAVSNLRPKTVFTNHTLVLEGQEMFAFDALEKFTRGICKENQIDFPSFARLGKLKPEDSLFSMTALALNISGKTNAVSKIHGEKAVLAWPGFPLTYITNGIYIPRWDKVGKQDVSTAHQKNEEKLLQLIRKVRSEKWNKEGLLLGWSRRFVPYKRPLAILDDVERLKQIIHYFKGKIHIVYSAPLSDADENTNVFLQRIHLLMSDELKGLITFIPNYNTEIAETMVSGCDVWLNTPIVGREACGTSGMKASLNGTLTLSTNDGWVREAAIDKLGWLVDDKNVSQNLLDIIQNKVLPLYEEYQLDPENSQWKKLMENSRKLISKDFSTKRMLQEYKTKLYDCI